MARIRTIKPELPSDPSLARCSREARLTFTYLITQSDDYGFVPAAPRQLIGLLYPHDEDVTPALVGRWINELVGVGLCAWAWTTDGLPLVQLLGWEQHQRIDNRRKPVLSSRLLLDKSEAPSYAAASVGVCDISHAEVRGELAATRGDSRLEPPTSDHGPPTSDLLLQKTPLSPTDAKVNTTGGWPAKVAEAWTRRIGVVQPGRVGKDLAAVVRLYPEPAAAERALLEAVTQYDASCTRKGQKPAWADFVRGVMNHVPQTMLPPERAA